MCLDGFIIEIRGDISSKFLYTATGCLTLSPKQELESGGPLSSRKNATGAGGPEEDSPLSKYSLRLDFNIVTPNVT